MNNLSTSEPSKSQINWSSMPWGTFLFLLAVFVLAHPLIRYHLSVRPEFSGLDDSFAMAEAIGRDNWLRIGALISLSAFALFHFLIIKQDRFQINGLLGRLILFYLIWAAFTVIWSIDPRFTLKRVGILLILSLGALYGADRLSFQETIALVFFICAVSLLGGLVADLRYHNFHPFNGSWRFGGNQHPVSQGWHCGLLLLSAVVLSKIAKKDRYVYIGVAFIACLFLVLTRSRMAFISTLIASAAFWSLSTPNRHQSLLFFFGITIGGCLIYFFFGNEIMGYSENIITLGRVGQYETTGTLTGRTPLWKAAMILVDQRPLLGYGYDSFLTGKNLAWMGKYLGWATPSPHSGYIAALGGLGYIGAVTLVLILILAITKSIRLARGNPEYAFMVAVFVWLICNLFTEDQVLARPYFPVFLWMIMLAKLGFRQEES